MTNNQLALWAALAAAVINFVLYGNLVAAVIGSGGMAYLLSRCMSWCIDTIQNYQNSK